ncbi:MAG: oxidoreductase [Burkholderiales bacterium]|nr:oxidoreductase [Burkholderiales bacterium]
MAMQLLMAATVRAVHDEATAIKMFDLAPLRRPAFPSFGPGAHVTVQLPNGLKRQYSITSDPQDLGRYRLAVLKEARGFGGSEAMHHLGPGERLYVSYPRNRFPMASGVRRHVFVAGGIGITPFVPMVMEARRARAAFELHYCARSRRHAAFVDELSMTCGDDLRLYFDGGDSRRGLDVNGLLFEPQPDTQVYCCGPTGLMDAVRAATARWPAGSVSFEAFVGASKAEAGVGEPFELLIQSTGQVLAVPGDRSALDVLRDNGFNIDSDCRAGACGTCKVRVVTGKPVHRDFALHPKVRNDHFCTCVSRATGRLTVDL